MSEGGNDLALLEQAKGGDQRAFRELVERYQGQVAAVVVRMLGPGDDADDVGQETFVRFYRAMDTFRGDSALGTWLTRIAMNLSLNALKKRKRETERYQPLDEEGSVGILGRACDPDVEIMRKEERVRIESALDTLSPDQRAVVVLRIREGRATAEVAEILGVPQGTVMSRLKRALAKLKEVLEVEIEE